MSHQMENEMETEVSGNNRVEGLPSKSKCPNIGVAVAGTKNHSDSSMRDPKLRV